MLNFENSNKFKYNDMKNDDKNKENYEDRPFTFKITKRRTPWTPDVLFYNIGRRCYNCTS